MIIIKYIFFYEFLISQNLVTSKFQTLYVIHSKYKIWNNGKQISFLCGIYISKTNNVLNILNNETLRDKERSFRRFSTNFKISKNSNKLFI